MVKLQYANAPAVLMPPPGLHLGVIQMRPKATTPSVQRTCIACGATFYTFPSRVRDGRRKFCSQKCLGAMFAVVARSRTLERFTSKVGSGADCWDWRGKIGTGGYGEFFVGSKTDGSRRFVKATRFAWELASGSPPPNDMLVCHTCDNRRCTRNDEPGVYFIRGIYRPRFGHLWLGTVADNTIDMIEKDRHRGPIRGLPTTCRNGHIRMAENTGTTKGMRICLECRRATYIRSRQRMDLHEYGATNPPKGGVRIRDE